MATQVQICNLTLIRLGSMPITSLLDDTKAAILLSATWGPILEEVLQAYPWKFATVRTTLTAETGTPDWGYSYQYLLPTDCLSLLSVEDDPDFDYRLENVLGTKAILCDQSADLRVQYTQVIADDYEQFPPHFTNTLAFRLAQEIGPNLTGKPEVGPAMMSAYNLALGSAETKDSREDGARKVESNAWIDARS